MRTRTIDYRSPATTTASRRADGGRSAAITGGSTLAVGYALVLAAVVLRYHADVLDGRNLLGLLFTGLCVPCAVLGFVFGRRAEVRSHGDRGNAVVVLAVALVPVAIGILAATPTYYGLNALH